MNDNDEIIDNYDDKEPSTIVPATQPTTHPRPTTSKWVNDTGITKLTETLFNQLNMNQATLKQNGDDVDSNIQYEQPKESIEPTNLNKQRIRFNLIRHRNTSCNTPTLTQFKSFATLLRQMDQNMAILPFQSDKQNVSSISNLKQINNIDATKLQLFFNPYYKKQFYSLSGYFHISSSMSFNAITEHKDMVEWLEENRYYMKLCTSQNEEMVQIGALCFSSMYIYREDLRLNIMQHSTWNPTNAPNPPVFDFLLSDFIGPNKKTKMLFIIGEKSRQNEIAAYFRNLYDGSPKEYPNGAMMVFIPLNEGTTYTPEERSRYIFNHETFLGDEAALCIGGLQDLNTKIKLKNDMTITIRMLLKSIPATQGMCRSQLFQFIEPNASGMVTLATYQSQDKKYVEERQLTLEQEIRQVLAHGEAEKVFKNDDEGIWFGSVSKQKNGRIISSQQPNKQNIEHKNHINTIMNSPPKKRPHTQTNPQPQKNSQYYYTITNSQRTPISARGGPPATHQTQTAQQNHNPPSDRLMTIEQELKLQHERNTIFDQRITGLENTSIRIDNNVAAILSKLDTMHHQTPSKQRKTSPRMTSSDHDMTCDDDLHPDHHHEYHPSGCNIP